MINNLIKRRSLLILTIAIFCFSSLNTINHVDAANQTVNPGVSSSTVNTAISSMGDGDSLFFNSGTYNNLQISVTKSINLIANGNVTLTRTGAGIKQGTAITIQKNNVNIVGFNINNYYEGIFSSSYNNSFITNNTITNNDLNGISLFSSNNILLNNIVNNNGGFWGMGNGIRVSGPNNILENNIANYNLQSGIFLSLNNNKLVNNTVKNNGKDGIEADGSYNSFINNTMSNNVNNGIIISNTLNISSYNTLSGNIVKNNNGHGIYLRGTNHLVENNIIGNNSNGILVDTGTNNINIKNNSIIKNRGSGIYIGGSNHDVQSNTIDSNNIGITLYCNSAFTNNKINYNRIVNSTNQQVTKAGTATITNSNANFNWWGVNNLANPITSISGFNVSNHFIIDLTNTSSLNNLGVGNSVNLIYTFKLNVTGLSYDLSYLPDFNTTIYDNNSYSIIIPAKTTYNFNYVIPYLGLINITANCDQAFVSIIINANKTLIQTIITIDHVNDSIYGQTIYFIAKLTYNTTGIANKIIEFWLNGINIGNATTNSQGIAILTFFVNDVRNNNQLEVRFAGDSDYNHTASFSNLFNFLKAPTNIDLTIEGLMEFNELLNFIGKISSNNNSLFNKNLEFWLNGINIGNINSDSQGIAILSYIFNEVKNGNILEVKFLGDSFYLNSSSLKTFNVVKKPTKVDLRIEGNPSYGETAQIVITLTDNNNIPIGNQNISLIINGVNFILETDQNGVAILNYKFLKTGSYYIIGQFLGNNNYKSSTAYLNIDIPKSNSSDAKQNNITLTTPNNYIKTENNKNFSIRYQISSNSNKTNVKIIIAIPKGLDYVSATASKGKINFDKNTNKLIWELDQFGSENSYFTVFETLDIIFKANKEGKYYLKPYINSSMNVNIYNNANTEITVYSKSNPTPNPNPNSNPEQEPTNNGYNVDNKNIIVKTNMKSTGNPLAILIITLIGTFSLILCKKE